MAQRAYFQFDDGTGVVDETFYITLGMPGTPGTAYKKLLSASVLDGLTFENEAWRLGQSVGAVGDPAVLLENRDIPLDGFRLRFFDDTNFGYISAPMLRLTHWRG